MTEHRTKEELADAVKVARKSLRNYALNTRDGLVYDLDALREAEARLRVQDGERIEVFVDAEHLVWFKEMKDEARLAKITAWTFPQAVSNGPAILTILHPEETESHE